LKGVGHQFVAGRLPIGNTKPSAQCQLINLKALIAQVLATVFVRLVSSRATSATRLSVMSFRLASSLARSRPQAQMRSVLLHHEMRYRLVSQRGIVPQHFVQLENQRGFALQHPQPREAFPLFGRSRSLAGGHIGLCQICHQRGRRAGVGRFHDDFGGLNDMLRFLVLFFLRVLAQQFGIIWRLSRRWRSTVSRSAKVGS
jgi:hypothetical protein